MKKLFTLLFLFAFAQLSFGQINGTKTVGSGGDYATIAAAITALNAGGVDGPLVFSLTDATYAEIGANLHINITTNFPTATNTVTFKPATAVVATVNITGCTATAGATQYAGFTINNNSYIIIDGSNSGTTSRDLTFVMNDATGRDGINLFGNCDNVTLKNFKVRYTGIQSATTGRGIYLNGRSTGAADNCTIDNCEIGTDSGTLVGPPHGIGFTGSSGSLIYCTNGTISNNLIYANIRGLNLFWHNGPSSTMNIFGNTISIMNPTATAGVTWGVLHQNYTGTTNFYNNRIQSITQKSTGTSGIYGFGTLNGVAGSGTITNVYNNFLGGAFNHTSTGVPAGVDGISFQDNPASNVIRVYYNTVVMNDFTNRSTTRNTCIRFNPVSTQTFEIRNNIFINNMGGSVAYVFHYGGGTALNFSSNYNNAYVSGASAHIGLATTNRTTLSAWSTAFTPNQDVNSKSVNVTFTSATDLHLAGSSVGDYDLAGTPIVGYTTDIDGQTRSTTAPYMGADENTNIFLATAHKRLVDAVATDWTGTASGTVHANVVSAEEAIYTGESGDVRTDQHGGDANGEWNNDITEFRFTRDNSYLYFMIKLRDILDLNRPYIAIGIDANQSDNTPAWLGDDSPVSLSPATNRAWERQLAVHATTSGVLNIEMFADDGSSWYAPPSNYQVVGSATNEVIEGRVALYDLGITTTSTLNLAVATFNNIVGFNTAVDATTGSFIDVVTAGYSGTANAWFRAGESNSGLNLNVSWNQDLSPLPIELTSFTALAKGSSVNLNWNTATEINSYGFEIERASTSSAATWQKVGFVKAAGNSNAPKAYSFVDNTVTSGKYQYRLKMVDNDGTFKYSNVAEADVTLPTEFSLSQNYPNPFNPVTRINYTLPVDANVQLYIYSITGELVKTLVSEYQTAGKYSVDFNGAALATGTYVYRLVANDFVQTKKMLILK